MTNQVEIPDKLFFKIGEVSRLTDVKSHVLRYWESEFPMLNPPKNRAAQRVFRKKDIETVLLIKTLLYDENYTISGARNRGLPASVTSTASPGAPNRTSPARS